MLKTRNVPDKLMPLFSKKAVPVVEMVEPRRKNQIPRTKFQKLNDFGSWFLVLGSGVGVHRIAADHRTGDLDTDLTILIDPVVGDQSKVGVDPDSVVVHHVVCSRRPIPRK